MSYPSATETPTEYHDRLCNATNGTPVMLWKTLKGLVYTLIFAAIGYIAVRNGAAPGTMALAVLVASGAAMVGELKEVEIANVVTLTFKRNGHSGEDDE